MNRAHGRDRFDHGPEDAHYCFHAGVEGPPGMPGMPGANGVSPTAEIRRVRDGHEVCITDINGKHVFRVRDGYGGDGLEAEDESGGCWYAPRGEDGEGWLFAENEDGVVWQFPVSESEPGDAELSDGDGNAWCMLMGGISPCNSYKEEADNNGTDPGN